MGDQVRSYRDLRIWRKGIELVKEVYELTKRFPTHERYGLADQLSRSSVSVPSNITEGQARQHTSEFRQILYVALGSAADVDTQITIARELGYVEEAEAGDIQDRIDELRRMTYGLIARLAS